MVSELFRAKPELLQRSWRASPDPEVDVLVARLDDKVIAVEVTRVLPNGGEAARRWESVQDRVVARAMDRYAQAPGPPIEVVTFWNAWTDPTSRRETTVVDGLVAFVNDHLPPDGEVVDFDVTDDPSLKLPYAIDRISIRNLGFPSHWHSPRFGIVGSLNRDAVASRIAAKNRKVLRYRGEYAERWLLLAVGVEGPSSWAIPTPELRESPFESHFDRVFVIFPRRAAVELSLSRVV